MMVTFISQCEKKALARTRRVLDAFADRIGDNTWQTVITEDGLAAVKKLLRKTATKSTAVACHWMRSRSRIELVWVVGRRDAFNERGVVPVNMTTADISKFQDKTQWKTLVLIRYAAAFAALFHDFGKANDLFQQKINPKSQTESFEPYRHEWVSLRLFQAFVGQSTDVEWIDALSQVNSELELTYFKDGLDDHKDTNNPLTCLPPFAQLVGWLILTHHKLPQSNNSDALITESNSWMNNLFEASWNSPKCKDKEQESRIKDNWCIKKADLPFASMQWRCHACLLASEAKFHLQPIMKENKNWLKDDLFSSHIARLALTLSDHHYSSMGSNPEWRSSTYSIYANTRYENNKLVYNQKLDEHLIGVTDHAKKIVNQLPRFLSTLRSLDIHKALESRIPKQQKEKFGWQDDAIDMCKKIAEQTQKNGFFGINMASTGCGKTRANAKIMYTLGRITGKIRFSVALGLRTLTMQTGEEFKKELGLSDDDLAIAVGGIAVKSLFEADNILKNLEVEQGIHGSESAQEYLPPEMYIHYQGKSEEHSLSEWIKPLSDRLLQPPVLVCTIDHLISATEGTRGGRQIAPMLRLLTSDLVLDEPDDFDLEDLPALCRLIHWAGMLGSRVLLSTATLPPALASACFEAYQSGWVAYAKANLMDYNGGIQCVWFDETQSSSEQLIHKLKDFGDAHKSFVDSRVQHLVGDHKSGLKQQKRKGEIVEIPQNAGDTVYGAIANAIHHSLVELHRHHSNPHPKNSKKKFSIGLVRMANIDPLVAVAKQLFQITTP
ncbi:MAG: type I-F CRISPR-associated helicase Cas3f, partial [Gammaproteobacteria bacterium]|nr:type I-F CRISPR-associated helicase Cas3f [Gammaproteobacteria bacterium]